LQSLFSQVNPELTIIFTGDIMGHDSQIESAFKTGNPGYDYTPCFRYIESYFSSADITVGNLEVTFAGPPYKGYPRFSSPDELGLALRSAGFDILLTANNHALDLGRHGLERTIETLDKQGFIYTGTFKNENIRSLTYPLIVEKNGIRLAILNYTYGSNELTPELPNFVNYLDTIQIGLDLRKAAVALPDFTIVTVHWGTEYELKENAEQRILASFMLRNGADAIIGSHPHVVQPIELTESGNIIVYSLGNFISNQRSRYRDGGIAFEMRLTKKGGKTTLTQYAYLPFWVCKPETDHGPVFQLMPAGINSEVAEYLNMPEDDYQLMKTFLKDTRTNLTGHPEVYPVWMNQFMKKQ
ncbi:MAG TPA: CapA family protein, partial [Bacteroidaceae bacterium]|nr:CapA family protein [Bacteroidaceae bacterium]